MGLDGQSLSVLAAGLVRPVGAAVDTHGVVFVADECDGAVWRITPKGEKTRIGGFGMPDDVALDPQGNLHAIDLASPIHALIRIDAISGARETLVRADLVEPQGLVIDARGDIFVADEAAHRIVEYVPS